MGKRARRATRVPSDAAAAREDGVEAADEEGPEEGQRIFPAAKRRFVRDKGHEMNKWLIGVCGLAAVLIVVLG